MKIIKRIIAAALCAAVAMSLAACHKKDAVAVSWGDYEIKSGLYMYMLVQADGEAREKLQKEYSDAGLDSSDIEYRKQKVEGTDFDQWVKDRALQLCREYIVTLKLFDENEVTVDETQLSMMDTYVSYYWSYAGWQSYYEPNGVSRDTFATFYETNAIKRQALFLHYYDEGGPKAVSDDEITNGLTANYAIADTITADITADGMTDEDIAALETELNAYADRINAGESFETIKAEYDAKHGTASNGDSGVDTEDMDVSDTASDNADGSESAEDYSKPVDPNAKVYGSSSTNESSDQFDTIAAMENGKAQVISTDEAYLLVVKKDITQDKYYFNNYRETVLYIVKQDEFNSFITEQAGGIELTVNNYEVNYLSPKKIEYPTSSGN
jgi:hypothetical protein